MGENGVSLIYELQHRKIAETVWGKPDGELKSIKKKHEWHFSSHDSFAPTPEKDTWQKTGHYGWFSFKKAKKALKDVEKGSNNGKFDTFSPYRVLEQRNRYEFRLVRVFRARFVEVTEHHTEKGKER